MSKETNRDKGILAIGAADRILKYLFRDVDPDRIEKEEVDEIDEIETEGE